MEESPPGSVLRRPRAGWLPRRACAAVVAVVAVCAAAACGDRRPVAVAVSVAEPFLDAARMGIEDARASGLAVAPDTVLLAAPTNRAAPALELARRFVDLPGIVAVVGHSNSAASLAAAPIYNQREVVQIAPNSSAAAYSAAGPYSFRLVPSDALQGEFLARRLEERFPGGTRVAVLYVNDDYGRGLMVSFRSALDTVRHPVVTSLPHRGEAVDTALVRETCDILESSRPDVLVWLGRPSTLVHFMDPIRRRLGPVPLLGSDAVASSEAVDTAAARWTDVMAVDFVDLDATAALRGFADRYRRRTGREPSGPDALTYDAVRLVLAGVAEGAGTGEELRRFLEGFGPGGDTFDGVTGPIRFDRAGDVTRSHVLVPVGSTAP